MRDNYAAEVKALSQHMGVHPDSMMFARLADRYLLLREVDKALDICQRGLRNHPNYVSAHFVLAKCHLALKHYDEAERRLKHVLSLDPHFLNAHKLYGDMMAEIGWTPQSHSSLKRLKDLDPLFPLKVVETAPPPAVVPEFEPAPAIVDQAPVFAEQPPAEREFSAAEITPEPMAQAPAQPSTLTPDIDVLPDLDEPGEGAGSDFEDEEARFSEILDDLFSPNIAEEEQRESEKRFTIERAAHQSAQVPPRTPSRPAEAAAPAAAKAANPAPQPQAPPPPAARRVEPVIPFSMEETWPPPAADAEPEVQAPAPSTAENEAAPLNFRSEEEQIDFKTPPATLPMREAQDTGMASAGDEPRNAAESRERSLEEDEDDLADFLSRLERMAEESSAAPGDDWQSTSQTETESGDDPLPNPAAANAPVASTHEGHRDRTKEKFVTPTLGEIYAAQGQYAKAISVFEMLLKKNPDNEWYKTKLDYLRKRLSEEKE